MDNKTEYKNISLIGEVVQSIEKERKRYLKIGNSLCYIELSRDIVPDVHLGDTIVIEGTLRINTVEPGFNLNRLDPVSSQSPSDRPQSDRPQSGRSPSDRPHSGRLSGNQFNV
jgi:hypothetical protein